MRNQQTTLLSSEGTLGEMECFSWRRHRSIDTRQEDLNGADGSNFQKVEVLSGLQISVDFPTKLNG